MKSQVTWAMYVCMLRWIDPEGVLPTGGRVAGSARPSTE